MKKIFCTAFLLITLISVPEPSFSFEFSNNVNAETNAAAVEQISVLSITSDWAIHFFQLFISPIDNRRCIFSPTCSVYARQAVKKYGFIKAYPLITARLIRCNGSAYYSRQYEYAGEGKGGPCHDPLQ